MSRRINAPVLMLASPLALALSLASREAQAVTVTVDANGACTMFEANATIHNRALLNPPPAPAPGCVLSDLGVSGFKIAVAAGTNHQLPSSINVSINLTVEGAGRTTTTLNSSGRGFLVSHPSRNPTLTLRNLTLRGAQAGTGIVVDSGLGGDAFSGPAHLILQNVRVTNHITGIGVFSEIAGDRVDATVQQSLIDSNLQSGIVSTNSNVSVLNSTIHSNGDSGIRATLTDDDVALDIANSSIRDNSVSGFGGGIMVDADGSTTPQLTVLDSTIERNEATADGGGIWIRGLAEVRRTNILSNTAQNGAGMYLQGDGQPSSNAQIDACRFASNVASSTGGAYFSSGQEDIDNSTFDDNRAQIAAGIFHDGAEIHLRHNTIVLNRASNFGGGVVIDTHSNPLFLHNIVATNTATNAHPDVVFTDALPPSIQAPARNWIGVVASSMAAAFPTGSPKFNIINPTPNLGSLQNLGGSTLVYPLPPGHPAIDFIPDSSTDHDQRGASRPLDGNDGASNNPRTGFDIGAYEAPGNVAVVATASASSQSMASRSAAMARDTFTATRWESGTNGSGTLQMTFSARVVESVTLREFGNRISAYRIEQRTGTTWSTLLTGTTVGNVKIHPFGRRAVTGMRVVVTGANGLPSLSEFEIY